MGVLVCACVDGACVDGYDALWGRRVTWYLRYSATTESAFSEGSSDSVKNVRDKCMNSNKDQPNPTTRPDELERELDGEPKAPGRP